MYSFTLKRHNSFQNKNNRKATHSFAPRPLIFKLQREVLKFNDIYVSWSSPKTDLKTNFKIEVFLQTQLLVLKCNFILISRYNETCKFLVKNTDVSKTQEFCHVIYIVFGSSQLRYSYAKFHYCGIYVINFRQLGLLAPSLNQIVSSSQKAHPDQLPAAKERERVTQANSQVTYPNMQTGFTRWSAFTRKGYNHP